MWGHRAYCWKTMDRPRRSGGSTIPLLLENTAWPFTSISPESGFSSPARHRSVVVFPQPLGPSNETRSEEHTSELQSLMRISYAVFCLKKKQQQKNTNNKYNTQQINT